LNLREIHPKLLPRALRDVVNLTNTYEQLRMDFAPHGGMETAIEPAISGLVQCPQHRERSPQKFRNEEIHWAIFRVKRFGGKMKTIGLIGGMSWESSLEYYRLINQEVKRRLGGLHSAKCVMVSVDFAEIERYQAQGDWIASGNALAKAAKSLENAGAECVTLCTNTMHKVAGDITAAVSIPLLHIADVTGEKIIQDGHKRIGLLGTRYTMEQDFYKQRLIDKFGLEVIIPEATDRDMVHRVIYDELCLGTCLDSSREEYKLVIAKLRDAGAEAVILGCTEIELLISQGDSVLPVYPTTTLHALGAVDFALS